MTSTAILGCDDRIELLSRKLDGDLSPAELRELDLHLESCPACRETLELLRGTVEAVATASFPPPVTLAPKVMTRLRDEGLVGIPQRPAAKLFFFRQAPMLAAAAIVVLATGTVILLRTRGIDQTTLLERGLDEAAGRAPAREALPEPKLPAPDLSAPAAPPPATMPIGRGAKEQPMLKSADDALAGAKRAPGARSERDRGATGGEFAPSPSAGGGSYAAEKKVAQNEPPRESAPGRARARAHRRDA